MKERGGFDSCYYCAACAFTMESTMVEHLKDCLSDANTDIIKMLKTGVKDFPDFSFAPKQTVLVVRSFR